MKNISSHQYNLTNQHGMQVSLMDYGATLTSLKVPDRQQGLVELTLGFDHLQDYQNHPFYFGCTIGRVANRIANGAFELNEQRFQLNCNENEFSHLHGGQQGFDKIFWQGAQHKNRVTFSHESLADAEYYPGNLIVSVAYELTDNNELKIYYTAQTDQPTPVNLTNHTYWNLCGAGSRDILTHEFEIFSNQYLETTIHHLPTGRLLDTKQSLFDFSNPTVLGERLATIPGYDHCYVLAQTLAARVYDPESGRRLEVETTQPGMQFYTGNYLTTYPIASAKMTKRWGAFCLETQGLPDAVNHSHFPSIILMPDQIYQHSTTYKFIF